MIQYDVAVIGAGLAGLTAALAAVEEGKSTVVVAKGMGNLYSASGYIDFLGYYPTTSLKGVENPQKALEKLIGKNGEHPYAVIGEKYIKEAFATFMEVSWKMGVPYTGSLSKNIPMPTAVGGLVPTTLYPISAAKNITQYEKIVVVGIKEHVDFYPQYVAQNLKKQLGKEIVWVWVQLDLNISRELNSFDLALMLEKEEYRKKIIHQLRNYDISQALVLIPALLGVTKGKEVLEDFEKSLNCHFLEIPTLPPSVVGYRLAEALQKYLKKKGVVFITGYPVVDSRCEGGICREIILDSPTGRGKIIKGKSYCLATGGILGEGLQVEPRKIIEDVFNLPVNIPSSYGREEFFALEAQPLSLAGVKTNEWLQPIDPQTKRVVLRNVHVAGATLAGYDPFLEKSGNGVALASGYKAGLLAAKGVEEVG